MAAVLIVLAYVIANPILSAVDVPFARINITPPSFANWHGFHLAAENLAFQDFPIILASFGLSNAESDR